MRHTLCGLLLAAGLLTPAFAQIRSGSIVGTVTDPTGAAVSGGEVKVTLLENNASYKTTTNDSGQYTIPYLQLGEYTVSIGKAGFKTTDITGVQVATAETVRVPVRLDVGAVTTSVEITAAAAGVGWGRGAPGTAASGARSVHPGGGATRQCRGLRCRWVPGRVASASSRTSRAPCLSSAWPMATSRKSSARTSSWTRRSSTPATTL